jgi:hypothetical protein
MAKKFIVDAPHGEPTVTALSSSSIMFTIVVVPIIVAVITTQYVNGTHFIASSVGVAGVAALLFIGIIRRGSRGEGLEITLTVNPLSVQIARSRRGTIIGYPILIFRKDIVDVVVNELVLSHKVVSVVVLRIKSPGHARYAGQDRNRDIPVSTLLKQGNVKLQVAFPGVEMSYMECMAMRHEICKALNQYQVHK